MLVAVMAGSALAATPPVNTVPPTLSGTAQDGKALTVTKGTWTGTVPITYTYQWQESSDAGATWTDIAGATATSYTPPAGFAGKQVHTIVTATNSAGFGQATSTSSAVILPGPPVNTVAPTLGGTAQDGKATTVAKGTWTGGATITYAYQWQVSTDGGATWTDIAGATGTSYTPAAGWAGRQLRAAVTATNADGAAQAVSPASAVILANPPVNAVAPTLGGTAQDGKAITVAKGTWTGMATIGYTYQWQMSTDGGATWTDVAGATTTTYTPPAGWAGRQARSVVSATNADGSSQATSAASAVIVANPPVNTVAPTLGGTAQDGKATTVARGTWTGMATITYAYQWQVSTDGGATWSDVSGATGTSYTPAAGWAGRELRAIVTATNGDGSAQAASPASAVILANPPLNTITPTISGTLQDGNVLTAAKGAWSGVATIAYAYQWQASSDGGATWTDIAGATTTTYSLPAGFAGKQVRVLVSAANGDGTGQALSAASAAIVANLPVNTAAPSISGTAQDAQPLTATTGTWTGMAMITYAYQWQESSDNGTTWTDVAGASASTYTPPLGSAGKQVRILVTATNGDGTGQTASAASAALLPNPPVTTAAPSLSGAAQDGSTLSTDGGTWAGATAVTYQWQISADGGTTWTDITGETGTRYTPPLGFAGKQVRIMVAATNGDGTTRAPSAASAALLPSPPVLTAVPALTGTAQDGNTLSSDNGSWTGGTAFTYQWQISADGGARWSDIAGATGSTYALNALAGKQVRVVVTAANVDGTTAAATAASTVILARPPSFPATAPAPLPEPVPAPKVEAPSPPPSLPSSGATGRPKPRTKLPPQLRTREKKAKQPKKGKKKRAPSAWEQLSAKRSK